MTSAAAVDRAERPSLAIVLRGAPDGRNTPGIASAACAWSRVFKTPQHAVEFVRREGARGRLSRRPGILPAWTRGEFAFLRVAGGENREARRNGKGLVRGGRNVVIHAGGGGREATNIGAALLFGDVVSKPHPAVRS